MEIEIRPIEELGIRKWQIQNHMGDKQWRWASGVQMPVRKQCSGRTGRPATSVLKLEKEGVRSLHSFSIQVLRDVLLGWE